jgi:hypothetical protein
MKLRVKAFHPGKDGAHKAQVQVLDQDEDPVTVLFFIDVDTLGEGLGMFRRVP